MLKLFLVNLIALNMCKAFEVETESNQTVNGQYYFGSLLNYTNTDDYAISVNLGSPI